MEALHEAFKGTLKLIGEIVCPQKFHSIEASTKFLGITPAISALILNILK